MENKYHDRAVNIVYAWEQNYDKSLTDRDREGLVLMIAENLQRTAYDAQQPSAHAAIHPRA